MDEKGRALDSGVRVWFEAGKNLLTVDGGYDLAMLESDGLDDVMFDFEEGEEVDLDPVSDPEESEVEELDLKREGRNDKRPEHGPEGSVFTLRCSASKRAVAGSSDVSSSP